MKPQDQEQNQNPDNNAPTSEQSSAVPPRPVNPRESSDPSISASEQFQQSDKHSEFERPTPPVGEPVITKPAPDTPDENANQAEASSSELTSNQKPESQSTSDVTASSPQDEADTTARVGDSRPVDQRGVGQQVNNQPAETPIVPHPNTQEGKKTEKADKGSGLLAKHGSKLVVVAAAVLGVLALIVGAVAFYSN